MSSSATIPKRRSKVRRLAAEFGVAVAPVAVCEGHSAPLDYLTEWVYDRPPMSVVHGPRGGGKSYLAALATHIDSLRYDRHGTKILGGSLAQSQQVYTALKDFDRAQPGDLPSFTKTAAEYVTGSEVSILAASPTSVRGPHVPTLRLDEVDEIDADIRDAAAGMCMAKDGVSASVSMTSTWHNIAGPMGALKEKAAESTCGFPWHTFCVFEVLERCPEERSGPALEKCPGCPLVKWCHADMDRTGVPKAKRSAGHYSIESLIQKVALVSLRVFESDYLCLGPRAAGLWFTTFDPSLHVSTVAEFDPRLPVWLAVDSGVETGAVWFQVRGDGIGASVNVFGDYYAFEVSAERNAADILEHGRILCLGRRERVVADPAGSSRNAVGPTVTAEYLRVGLTDPQGQIEHWPNYGGSVRASLDLVEALLGSANGTVSLRIHPRCRSLIQAFQNYRRAKRAGQWQDKPEEPQHPHEEMIDALRGGLLTRFPEGRKPATVLRTVSARGGRFR